MRVIRQRLQQITRAQKTSLKGVVAVAIALLCLVASDSVSAIGAWAPDAGDFGAGDDIFLLVSQQKLNNDANGGANGLDAPESRVTIYSLVKNPTIKILNPNQCRNGDPDTSNNPYQDLAYTTSFRFSWDGDAKEPAGSKDPDDDDWGRNYVGDKGSGQCTAANNEWNTSFNLPESSARTLDGQKYYVVDLTAKIRTDVPHGSVNAFKVHTSSGYVSYTSASSRKFALQDRIDGSGTEPSVFNLYFALPCNAENQNKTFEWFDADQNQGNQSGTISYELWRKPRSGPGGWEKQSGPFTDLGGNDVGGSKSHWLGKNYIYNWKWIGVEKSNGIQFEIPFNSINATLACKETARVTPSVSLNPSGTVTAGDNITADARFTNSTDFTAKVKYTRQFWKSNGTDGFSVAQGDVAVHPTETDTVDVPKTDLNMANWTALADGNFGYMCTALINISAQDTASVNTILSADHAGPLCVPVGKYPGLKVSGGDLRTGGTFASSSQASCKLPVGTPSVYATDQSKYLRQFDVQGHNYALDGVSKGSYGNHATVSPGVITHFGSHGSYYAGYDTASARLLFGSRKGHVPNWAQEGYYYGATATTSTASHCLASLKGLTASGAPQVSMNKTISAADSGYYSFGGNKSGTLTVQGTTFGINGGRHIVRVTQDDVPRTNAELNKVLITDDVIFSSGPYGSIAALPQFILIIEKRIKLVFADEVTRFDGIISTRGDIFTCGGVGNTGFAGSGTLTKSGTCDNALTINGTVITARGVYPYRTAGFNTKVDMSVAELFNLRPDILLGDYARGQSTLNLRTIYQEEAPPRF